MAQTKVNFKDAAGVSYDSPSSHYNVGPTAQDGTYTNVVLPFPEITGGLEFKKINSVVFYFYVDRFTGSLNVTRLSLSSITNDVNVNSVTYDQIKRTGNYEVVVNKDFVPGWLSSDWNFSSAVKNHYGLLFTVSPYCTYHTPYGSNKPYLLIDHDDEVAGLEPYDLSPVTFATQSIAQTFSWKLSTSGFTLETLSSVSTKLQWRQNQSSSVYDIDANNELSVSVPAGTFQSGKIQIRVAVTSNSGATKYTQWYDIDVLSPKINSPSPSSGYIPKNKENQFNWALVQPINNEENVQATQLSAVFKWRERDGATIHEIQVTGPQTRVTVPAGTFTSDSIQWMVTAIAEGNVSVSSEWMTCPTIEPASTAKAISPKTIVIQSGADIQFVWEHIIATGSAPTGFDIQYSTDKLDWHMLLTGKTSATTALLEDNALPGGTVYWRVRTYNTDAVAGEWSDPAEIIVIAPPDAPVIVLDQISPQPIIRWIAQGQISYELEIDKAESVSRYGNENRYQAKTVLSDGLHTVRVRIQNSYSLWSKWAEASFTVFNSPGAEITLTATPDSMGNVSLSWSVAGLFERYEVLRDGNVIARTATTSFKDRLAIGSAQYQVRGIVDEAGNYSLSNAVEQAVSVRYVQIAPVSGGEWLALPYSTTDIREVSTNVSRAVTYQQYTGAKLPTATVSEALTVSHQIAAAFPWSQKADADRLEAMIGQLVCVKDPRGERFVGVLGSYSKTSSRFYVAYSLTITPVDWEEVST